MSKLEEQIAHLPDLDWNINNLPDKLLPFEIGVISVNRTAILAFVLGKSKSRDGGLHIVYSARILKDSDKVPGFDIKYINTDIVTGYQGTGLNFNRFK